MTKWIFMAYKNEDDEIPYFTKEFHSHIKLKNFSAKHSGIEKKKYPNYCSDYIKMNRKITITLEFNEDWDDYENVSTELLLEDSGIYEGLKDGVKVIIETNEE